MAIEFKPVADAALAMAQVLLPQWIGGKRVGHEWQGERKVNGGLGDSWAINLNTGAWLHGAGDEKGGDLVSLFAALNHLDQLPALQQVAGLVGINERNVSLLPIVKPPEKPPETIPDEPPLVPAHPSLGAPTLSHRYEDAFVVARFDPPSGKTYRQFTWRDGRWVAKGYPAPLPLYGRLLLRKYPNGPVLIVEGEKCADVARGTMRSYVVLTWAGGASAVKKSDWTVLADRDVVIWPDADEPGMKAAATIAEILTTIAARVRVINPEGQPESWDIADAIQEGWDVKRITGWATEHIKTVVPAQEILGPPEPPPPAPVEESAVVNWSTLNLDCNEGGVPHPTVANASQILMAHPKFRSHIWYDTFKGAIYHDLNGIVEQWTDHNDLSLCVHIQHSLKLPKFTLGLVRDAVQHAAQQCARNSLTSWLDSLKWDGTSRLDHWLVDSLGCERIDYTVALGRNWLISMVARAYKPGCQVDTMPVLEGPQGRGKSTFLEALGGEWYGSVSAAFGDKEFLQEIQGHWLVEIPDMTGFSRKEHSHILATITIRTDVYRPPYGHYVMQHPRVAVFAATSESDKYLKDAQGRRRYWPIRCGAIDVGVLRMQREQLFAEAVKEYRKGSPWHIMPASTNDEQMSRTIRDAWNDQVLDYADRAYAGGKKINTTDVLVYGLDIPIGKCGDLESKRIARILREAGWLSTRTSTARYWRKPPAPVLFDDDQSK